MTQATKTRARKAPAQGHGMGINPKPITDKEFAHFSKFIYDEVGIKLPPVKRTMIQARLHKRLRALHMREFDEYFGFLFSERGLVEELPHLIDAVTTNTTDFFREPKHFELLATTLLPQWSQTRRGAKLKVWSAGCSFGMEPYTLSMVLSDHAERFPDFRFSVLATDISVRALQAAMRGIYDEERVKPVPVQLKHRYVMRSKDRSKKLVRIVPELRNVIDFRRLNFMGDFALEEKQDIIFCRNVIIYFDRPTQERLFTKFCANLNVGGYIFIGHSESLAGMTLPLEQVAPTVYRKVG